MSTNNVSPFTVRVAQDRLSATIEAGAQVDVRAVTVEDVMAAIQTADISSVDPVVLRVDEYLEALRAAEGRPVSAFEIARGRARVEPQDGKLVWDESFEDQSADSDEDGAVDFYSICAIRTVESGGKIGTIMSPRPGVDGVDVHGTPIPVTGTPRELTLKKEVRLDDDGTSVFATTSGRVLLRDQSLSVTEVVEIAGDVNFETGNLDLTTDTLVRGTVRDLFEVKTKKSLTVGGTIEAATIEADGDVVVRGGILNRGKGKVVAGGQIAAKFCDEADLRAKGDILISKETMNSRVHSEDRILIPQGAIIGGEVFARRGIEVGTIGSEASVPTVVAVGLHPSEVRTIEDTAKENVKRVAAVQKIRQTVGPLMAQLKRLTGPQREKATELMYQADSLEAEIRKSEAMVNTLLGRDDNATPPFLLLTSRAYQRVSVSVGDRVVTFSEEFKGPIKIERRKTKSYTALIAVNQLTGSIRELPARKLEAPSEPAQPAQRATR